MLGLENSLVQLVPHNPQWKDAFYATKKEILAATNLPAHTIEHIGSTAISGIQAKPILDLAVGIPDLNALPPDLERALQSVGFYRLRVIRPDSIVFAKFTDSTFRAKTHFLHLVERPGETWENFLFFRDYLNTNDETKRAYEQLKTGFLAQNSPDREAYTAHKEHFVKSILQKRRT